MILLIVPLLYIFFVVCTTLAAINLIQVILYLVFKGRRLQLYRQINYHLVHAFYSAIVFTLNRWSRLTIKIFMTDNDKDRVCKEHSVVVMNHSIGFDIFFPLFIHNRLGAIGGLKTFIKKELRVIPFVGWLGCFSDHVFVERNFKTDAKIIDDGMKKLVDYPDGYWTSLYLPAEGTRFTEEKHAASMDIAREKGLPELKYHLLPRTKGFVCCISAARDKLPAVYDVTYVMTGESDPSLMGLISRREEYTLNIRIQRYSVNDLPKTEEGLADWLMKLYQKKDIYVDGFHKNKTFDLPENTPPPSLYDIIVFGVVALLVSPLVYKVIIYILLGSITQKIGILISAGLFCGFVAWVLNQTSIHKSTKFNNNKKSK